MDDSQEQDQHEERLKEVFNSFDTSGSGSLCLDELSELCQSLHLGDATPTLLCTLLRNQDHLTARVRLFACHWIRKTVVLSHRSNMLCNFWSHLLRKPVFAFLPFVPSLVYMGDMFFGFNMCRSSTSFEFGRHLRRATPALRPLCVQAFCRFVSHLVEKMYPHQPWAQVSVVRTTKPTNHHSRMQYFEGSPCGNVWNRTSVTSLICTFGLHKMHCTFTGSQAISIKSQVERWNLYSKLLHTSFVWKREDRRMAIVSCGRG